VFFTVNLLSALPFGDSETCFSSGKTRVTVGRTGRPGIEFHYALPMQLAKDSCACGHPMEQHDGGRGGPCNTCACAAGAAPSAFEVGLIHSLHDIAVLLARMAKEQAKK